MSTDQPPHPVQPAARVEELLEVIEQQADRIADLEAERDEMRDERDEAVALLNQRFRL